MSILVFNAGSSSLKIALFSRPELNPVAKAVARFSNGEARMSVDRADGTRSEIAAPEGLARERRMMWSVQTALGPEGILSAGALDQIEAVGHRVAHGGALFREPTWIDADARRRLDALTPLAPLHNPPALEVIDAVSERLPGVRQAAVFDTAFHAALPLVEQVYPLPWEWFERDGVRRYGFHGVSYAGALRRVAELANRPADSMRIIIFHLGAGASATAIRDGRSVATTMGFTPLDGLMMATRPGSVDPGALLHELRLNGGSVENLEQALNLNSGLKGVSGISGDYQELERLADAAASDPRSARAALALEMFASRARKALGELAVTLGGLDAVAFTGGVGENSFRARRDILAGTEFLGLRLDDAKNESGTKDRKISSDNSAVRIFVIKAREELEIAREVRRMTW